MDRLKAQIGAADTEILDDLKDLGYSQEVVALIHLVPLLQVAWAEDKVTNRERELILETARLRGIDKDSASYARLAEWLQTRPSDDFFERTLRVISALVDQMPSEERKNQKRELLAYSTKVAETSGGLLSTLGLSNKVSDKEREVLESIADALG
jgi:hypothetical protein